MFLKEYLDFILDKGLKYIHVLGHEIHPEFIILLHSSFDDGIVFEAFVQVRSPLSVGGGGVLGFLGWSFPWLGFYISVEFAVGVGVAFEDIVVFRLDNVSLDHHGC